MSGELVDIGINLMHRRYDRDREAVIARAVAASVSRMVITGTSEADSVKAQAFAARSQGASGVGIYATAGVHPHHAKDFTAQTLSTLQQLAARPEVVAIGECGLDFNRDFSPRPVQERVFAAQLALAAKVRKPVFLHDRDAHPRFLAILKEQRAQLVGGVVHCFTGTREELDVIPGAGYAHRHHRLDLRRASRPEPARAGEAHSATAIDVRDRWAVSAASGSAGGAQRRSQ